jgi:hypothetical protein
MEGRLAQGYLRLPTDLDEGYYRFRAFTLTDLVEAGQYIYADIPVYSEWSENITVYKFEEVPEDQNDTENKGERIRPERGSRSFVRRDSIYYNSLFEGLDSADYIVFWVEPREYAKFPSLPSESKEISGHSEIHSDIITEDSLYFEAMLTEQASGDEVTSNLISIFSGRDKRFFRAKAQSGWLNLKIPDYQGDFTLQVFNLNPYQQAVNNLRVKNWTINEGYFNPSTPPVTPEIADYLIKSKQRRKIYDMFIEEASLNGIVPEDSSAAIPDLRFKMDEYQNITNLQNFIFEAVPGARIIKEKDGNESVRLYNPERKSIFMDKPWYIVDGYLTSREEEVLKIPFKDIDEIKLYVHTNTIRNYFEYFLWRNGILEVKTKDVKYLRSLKTDPNYVDFTGFLPEMRFLETVINIDPELPDFRTTVFWQTGIWGLSFQDRSFPLSDDTGRFTYHLLAINGSGEIIRKEGEFEVY